MQAFSSGKHKIKEICALIFCISIIILGAVCCGNGISTPYTGPFSLSSGQCKGDNAAPVAGEKTLAIAALDGEDITICILRASDGVLLRHYDLDIHGSVVGQGDGLLYVDKRTSGDSSLALCAVEIDNGITRWCQTQVMNVATITQASGVIYAGTLDQSSGAGSVVAINERDGQLLWHFNTQANPGTSGHPLFALDQGIVYVNDYRPPVTSTATPGTGGSVPTPGISSVCALRANNGSKLWCVSLSAQSVTNLVADENGLYMWTESTEGVDGSTTNYDDPTNLAAYSASGLKRWSLTFPSAGLTISRFLIARGMLFTSWTGGQDWEYQLDALRTSDGQALWHIKKQSQAISMSITDSFIFIVNATGEIQVFNLLNGTSTWSRQNLISPFSPRKDQIFETLAGQGVTYVLVATPDGNSSYYISYLLALRVRDGATVWEDQTCGNSSVATAIAYTSTAVASPSAIRGTNARCYWNTFQQYTVNSPASSVLLLQVDN
jgi:outer membrane protein assembly factor BamB